MVSYGLTKSIGSELSANDYEKGPNSSTQTPSKSASSAQIASLKSSATTNKIPLIYSTSPGNSPSSISLSSSKTATPQARIMNNTASLSPSKALEMVSAEVSRRQENFHSLIQEKRTQTYRIFKDLQYHDHQMKESMDAALLEFEKLKLAEEKGEKERILADQEKKEEEKAEERKREKEMLQKRQDQLVKAQEAHEKTKNAISENPTPEKIEEKKANLESTTKIQESQSIPPPPQIVSETAFAVALKCLDRVNNIKTSIKPTLLSNPASANQIMKDKMLINRSVGQLTRSMKQLVPLVKKLAEIFSNAKAKSTELYELLMYLAAKKIVKQSEMEVSVKQDSAFPLAILAVHLSSKHPAFQEVLFGRMIKKCPYIVPMYPRKQPNESLKEYQKRLGYNVKNDPIETDIQYGERMCGIISLYSAMIQTDDIHNSYGIENGWTWLARILNMKPRKLTPLLIHTFLVIAGHKLVAEYKDQALKMMHVLQDCLIPIIPKSAIASTTKLTLFLEESIKKTSSFPVHPGKKMEP